MADKKGEGNNTQKGSGTATNRKSSTGNESFKDSVKTNIVLSRPSPEPSPKPKQGK